MLLRHFDWIAPALTACLGAAALGQEAPDTAKDAPSATPAVASSLPLSLPDDPTPDPAPSSEDATPPGPTAPQAPSADAAPAAAPEAPAAPTTIRFAFKDQQWDQVLDWFSRTTRMPVVRETPAPASTVDFISDRAYELPEALQVLNTLLQTQGVMLRRERDTLFLQKLDDMKRENIPTFVDRLPEEITDDQIVTLLLPLRNATSTAVAEALRNLVASYGSVTDLAQSNSVVLVETAANLRRLQTIIAEIDKADVENIVEYIPLRYAKAESMLRSLTGLMAERQVQFVIQPDGKRVRVSEDKIVGLSLTADPRTNAIIGRGTRARLDQLRETIALLDVPMQDETRTLRTIALGRLNPQEARGAIDAFLQSMAPERRPTIIMLPERSGVALVGEAGALDEVSAFMREAAGSGPEGPSRSLRTFTLVNTTTTAMIPALRAMLTDAQMRTLRLAQGADDRSLLALGDTDAVETVVELVEALDQPARRDARVRVIPIANADAARVAERARELFLRGEGAASAEGAAPALPSPTVEVDTEGSAIIVAGREDAVDAFERMINQARTLTPPERSGRLVVVRERRAEDLIDPLRQALATVAPKQGGRVPEPVTIETIASANALWVTGEPQQLALAELVARELDRTDRSTRQVRTYQPKHLDPAALVQGAQRLVAATRNEGPGAPEFQVDPRGTSVLVIADHAEMEGAMAALHTCDEGAATASETIVRVYPLTQADSNDVAAALQRALDGRGPVRPGAPRPVVAAERSSNSIVVTMSPDDLETIEDLIKPLDTGVAKESAQVRTVVLRHARAEQLAPLVERLLAEQNLVNPADLPSWARSEFIRNRLAGSGRTPVRVAADQRLNAIIVTAPRAVLTVAEQLIEQLDAAGAEQHARSVRVLEIRNADAGEIAGALEQVFQGDGSAEAPPVIRVNTASNSLLVRASDEQFSVIERVSRALDKGSIVTSRQMRTLAIDPSRANAEEVARVLGRMASSGADGAEAIKVVRLEDLMREYGVAPAGASAPATTTAPANKMPAAPVAPGALRDDAAADAPASAAAGDATEPPPTIAVDPATNAIVLIGGRRWVDRMSQLAMQIAEQLPAPSTEVRVIQVPEGVDVNRLRMLLTEAMRVVTPPGGRPGDLSRRVSLLADAPSRALVVAATDTDFRQIAPILAAISRTSGTEPVLVRSLEPRFVTAGQAVDTIRQIMGARARASAAAGGAPGPQAEFAIDPRGDGIFAIGSESALDEVQRFLELVDAGPRAGETPLRIFELEYLRPQSAARLVREVVLAGEAAEAARTTLIPEEELGLLLVRAPEAITQRIDAVLREIDRASTSGLELRTLKLERADAQLVAEVLQRFFDDRARVTGAARGRQLPRSVAIVPDPRSGTLLISASDADFAEVTRVAKELDAPMAASDLQFRIFPLRHAEASEVVDLVRTLATELTESEMPFFWMRRQTPRASTRDAFAVRADDRLNALIVTGRGDRFALVENLLAAIDAPVEQGQGRQLRFYRVKNADIYMVLQLANDALGRSGADRRWWEGERATRARIVADPGTSTLIVSATEAQQREVAALIQSIDEAVTRPQVDMAVIALEFAPAQDTAQTLRRFLAERAAGDQAAVQATAIVPSVSANTLLVSAPTEVLATIRDLVAKIDQPSASADRTIEIIKLKKGLASDITRIVQEQFTRRGGAAQGVIVTSDARTNSIIVNAPEQLFEQVKALITRLDTPTDADESVIRTFALTGAKADEAVRILSQTLQLDAQGRPRGVTIRLDDEAAPPVEVRARIVADRRSNSLVVTATPESIPVIESLISKIDTVPARASLEYRVIPLTHVAASDLSWTLRQMLRTREPGETDIRVDYDNQENRLIVGATPEQFREVERIINELDRPSERSRVTEFVALKHAQSEQVRQALSFFYGPGAVDAAGQAQRSVIIVADPASNSLVISAAKDEWDGIRTLLEKLDSADYDASLQLRVIALAHADAPSVAEAINGAFRITTEARPDRAAPRRDADRGRDGQRPEDAPPPAVLVPPDRWVSATAEPRTNAIIISASRQNLVKIEAIIAQIDVAESSKLPPPRLIPVESGSPEQLAQALREIYADRTAGRGAPPGREGGRGVRIVGDVSSGVIIVRASEEEFAAIQALAEALQQQVDSRGLTVRVMRLAQAPAVRVANAVRDAFTTRARQSNLPFSIQADPSSNAVVVAATGALWTEIEATVKALDQMTPSAGQQVLIIDLNNVTPETVERVIRTLGLEREQAPESATRLVNEPVRIAPVPGRNAVMVVAGAGDRETVVALVKAIDEEPKLAEMQMQVVRLRNASAPTIVATLLQMLSTGPGAAAGQAPTVSPLLRSLQEQVRRLTLRRDGADQPDIAFDLAQPIKLVADERMNAIVIGSTPSNVAALREAVALLDSVPTTDGVSVRIFPLENMAAAQFARLVRELFQQGRNLANVPLSTAKAMPGGEVGKALVGEIAIAVDERTNTVVVAGRDEAVAFVEVLHRRLDSDAVTGWVEPRIFQLRHADARDLATTLSDVLAEANSTGRGGRGGGATSELSPLQRQVARLRMIRLDPNGAARPIDSDLFAPLTQLVVRPDPGMNALICIGTPANLDIIGELVKLLDVEAAGPSALVRVYPVQNASAARLANTIQQLFEAQFQAKAIRDDDRLKVVPDERTNALVVSTSTRSFAVFEQLLGQLDQKIAPEIREIRTVGLRSASAVRLAPIIQQVLDARLERLRRVQPETAELERVVIVPDSRSNALIVSAAQESWQVVERLVGELDRDLDADQSAMHVLTIKKANLDRVASAINEIMDRRYADLPNEMRRRVRPLVLTDPRTSSLLISAAPGDYTDIERLVQQLEATPMDPAVSVDVITLVTARAEQLAPRLQTLMRERMATLGGAETPSDRVSIAPDPASNSLIVAASEENLAIIRQLVEALSKAGEEAVEGRQVELVLLSKSRAQDLVPVLNDLYVNEQNRRRGENAVRVTADQRLNALLITGLEPDVAAVKRMAGELDGTRPATVVEIKALALASANVVETVNLIENVLAGNTLAGGRPGQQATVVKYMRQIHGDPDGAPMETEVSAAVRASISLVPDIRTNTIIVRAPRDAMELIERMVRDLDQSSAGSQSIKVLRLANADATQMGRLLTELFNLRQQGNLFVLKPREGVPGAPLEPIIDPAFGGDALFGSDLTMVPDPRQALSITVDTRTNSLLVSGTPTYLELVDKVVRELDGQTANERETKIFALKNAAADNVARIVSEFVDTDQRKVIATLGTGQIGSASRLLEREVTIVGDTKTNAVLVTASPRYLETLTQVIHELDVDPPQVLIQVVLAEVTLGNSEDLGLEFTRFQVGSVNVAGGFGLPRSPFASGISIPGLAGLAPAVFGSAGLPNIAIGSSQFDLLLNALKSQNRVQLLSNPSVMVANNTRGFIQVGETVRLPNSVSFSAAGQQSSVDPEDIGVILNVTPSINPDGFVRLEIEPEISFLSKETTQISENFESPVITRRRANTTVTVKDGQTVVIGGLIQDRFERIDKKIPFLGDIPIVGFLFSNKSEQVQKTELLIVLTPHVVRSPESARERSQGMLEKLSLPPSLKRQIEVGELQGLHGAVDDQGRLIDPIGAPSATKVQDIGGPQVPATQGSNGGGGSR
ncbi:MAG: hypothetical protein KF724_00605 [Phycisphaeraceae bacterium]|nr:hypothetical protein [Phycisphaeraceae bacterium]